MANTNSPNYFSKVECFSDRFNLVNDMFEIWARKLEWIALDFLFELMCS